MAEQVIVNFVGQDDVSPVARKVENSIKDIGNTTEKSGGKFSSMQEMARGAFQSIGAGAINLAGQIGSSIVSGIGSFITDGIAEAQGWQDAFRQTQAVVESTGMAAGFTAEQLGEMAGAMSATAGTSLFTDDEILKAQNVLLTFTKVTGEQFEGAMQAGLDMAQALGMDASSASMMLGKALNDPVKGLSALSRSGVSFTEEQKAMVEAMVEAGDVAGAQNLILKEMEVQFGGSALAATETFTGAQKLLEEQMNNAKESIGTALLPILTRLSNVLMSTVVPIVQRTAEGFAAFLTGLDWDSIITTLSALVNQFTSFGSSVPWGAISGGFDSVIAAVMTATPLFEAIAGNVVRLFAAFTGPEAQGAASGLASVIGMIIGILGGLWSTIQSTLTAVINALSPIVAEIIRFAFEIVSAITTTLQSPEVANAFAQFQVLFATVGVVVKELAEVIGTVLVFALDNLKVAFDFLWPVIDYVFKQIMNAISFAIPIVTGLLNSVIMVLNGDFAGAWANIQRVISTAWTAIKAAVQTGIDGIKSAFKVFIDSASSIGSDIVDGIARGISSGARRIADAAKSAAQSALDSAKALLGISSPSKLFADSVGLPISQGIAAGIAKGAPEINGALSTTMGGASAGTTQTVQNYYLSATYNTRQSESSIMADLRAMQLLSGAV
jgi:phage-related protein